VRKRFVIGLVLISLLLACKEYPCAKAFLNFRLVGFSEAEADTIILKRFTKNQSAPLDSFIFDVNNPVRFIKFGDTLYPNQYPPTLLMQSDLDYELVLPGATRFFRITEIREEQVYTKKDLFGSVSDCVNQLTSLKVDGQPVTAIEFPNSVYLRK